MVRHVCLYTLPLHSNFPQTLEQRALTAQLRGAPHCKNHDRTALTACVRKSAANDSHRMDNRPCITHFKHSVENPHPPGSNHRTFLLFNVSQENYGQSKYVLFPPRGTAWCKVCPVVCNILRVKSLRNEPNMKVKSAQISHIVLIDYSVQKPLVIRDQEGLGHPEAVAWRIIVGASESPG